MPMATLTTMSATVPALLPRVAFQRLSPAFVFLQVFGHGATPSVSQSDRAGARRMRLGKDRASSIMELKSAYWVAEYCTWVRLER